MATMQSLHFALLPRSFCKLFWAQLSTSMGVVIPDHWRALERRKRLVCLNDEIRVEEPWLLVFRFRSIISQNLRHRFIESAGAPQEVEKSRETTEVRKWTAVIPDLSGRGRCCYCNCGECSSLYRRPREEAVIERRCCARVGGGQCVQSSCWRWA